ncbi:NAD-dependent epimerase/dehydratase family protein [Microbacterium sp. NPDC077663]|uniref:NAD-dependent epimerase/dehydratase family protein n=1 Tax=Microbacterium sp. NPDC077663 TaxID=3364189 RepID=UPI0037C9020C
MRVLVLGAGGFIGSHTVAALVARGDVDVSAGLRNSVSGGVLPRGVDLRVADVLERDGVTSALADADVVVHAVSYTGSDPDLVQATNVEATRNLLRALSNRPNVRLVFVSTTSVYGTGPHRGAVEGELSLHPESPISAARAAAEQLVLEAGGKVVRAAPALGIGDRWFGPALLRGASALGGLPGGGRSRLSVIPARSLGVALAALAAGFDSVDGQVIHAVHPRPITVAGLVELLTQGNGSSVPTEAIPADQVARRASALGFTDHQLALISIDHWYDSTELSALLPGEPELSLTPEERGWYARFLS